MASKRMIKFLNNEKEFMSDTYSNLSDHEKIGLWMFRLTFDFMDNSSHDPLNKFTPDNYKKWLSIESNFDKFLDVILDQVEAISPWHEGCGWNDCKTEINKRLGRGE